MALGNIAGVPLEDILEAREARAEMQKVLIERFGLPLVSFTVNFPGNRKDTELSRKVFGEGLKAFGHRLEREGLRVENQEIYYRPTGPEAYISVNAGELQLKLLAVELEETHPVGRLFDFDVIGRSFERLGRAEQGLEARKCFICGSAAHACARSRRHTIEELRDYIERLTAEYL